MRMRAGLLVADGLEAARAIGKVLHLHLGLLLIVSRLDFVGAGTLTILGVVRVIVFRTRPTSSRQNAIASL